MREIKFRAWDGQKMYQHHDVWAFSRGEKIVIKIDLKNPNPKPEDETYTALPQCDLMQYIGLKDKNGKEIYEGDIVTIPYIDPMGGLHTDIPNGNSSVGFENGQFVIYRTEPQALIEWCKKEKGEYVSNYGNLTIVSDTTVLEIIGNIYENPELIKP